MLYELDAVAFPATSFAFSSPPCFYMFFNGDDDDRYVAAGEHILFLAFKDNAEERIRKLVQRVYCTGNSNLAKLHKRTRRGPYPGTTSLLSFVPFHTLKRSARTAKERARATLIIDSGRARLGLGRGYGPGFV